MKNRWLIAVSVVGIHVSIGSVYAWSVVTKPLIENLHWSLTQVSFVFSLAIFFLGMIAALFGRAVEAIGPRKSGSMAAILFGLGLIGSGIAVSL